MEDYLRVYEVKSAENNISIPRFINENYIEVKETKLLNEIKNEEINSNKTVNISGAVDKFCYEVGKFVIAFAIMISCIYIGSWVISGLLYVCDPLMTLLIDYSWLVSLVLGIGGSLVYLVSVLISRNKYNERG